MTLALSEYLPLIASAPGGIQKLRGLILELAVRGKLVPQLTEEESASFLLERIRKDRLSQQSELRAKRSKPLPSISGSDLPFSLPTNWVWVRNAELFSLRKGKVPKDLSESTGNIPYLDIEALDRGNIRRYTNDLTVPASTSSDILVVCDGSRSGLLLNGSAGAIGSTLAVIDTPLYIQKFVQLIFREAYERLNASMKGAAIPHLDTARLLLDIVALPPISEQHRIVAKVDELMVLCDRLESEQNDSAAAHAQLVETLLRTLTQSTDTADFEANWKRIAEHFDTLFTTESSIDALQKSILQLAVIGMLTSQDSTDESASDLLARIGLRHKTTKTKTQNPTDIILPSLPGSWAWSKLKFLITLMDSGWSPACIPTPSPNSQTWGVLKTTAVQTLKFIESENKELPEHLTPRLDCEVAKGDILITRAGPQNRVAISCLVESTRPKLMISDKIIRFRLTDNGMHDKFVALCLNAGATAAYLESAKSGMAASQMNITQEKLKAAPIPICSHNEQVRIVSKVDELMSVCESLKAKLAAAEKERSALAETLIKRALAA